MHFQHACNWYPTRGRDKMLESRAATKRGQDRNVMKFIKNKIKILIWAGTHPCNNQNWRITIQIQAWDSSDHQVEYELGEYACSTEGCGKAYILGCIIKHNLQELGSGSSCYAALVRPNLECCSSGLPSTGEHQCPRVRPEEASKMAGSWMKLWGEAERSGPTQS